MRTVGLMTVVTVVLALAACAGGPDASGTSDGGEAYCGPVDAGRYAVDLTRTEYVRGNCPTHLRAFPVDVGTGARGPIYSVDMCTAIVTTAGYTVEIEQPSAGRMAVVVELDNPVCTATYVGSR